MSAEIIRIPCSLEPAFETVEEMPPPCGETSNANDVRGRAIILPTMARTDFGNAERLVHRHGRDLRYAKTHGWLAWDARRWVRDDTGEVMRRAKDTVRAIYTEITSIDGKAERTELGEHAIHSESSARLHAMVLLAESEKGVATTADKLDLNPWLLNVENGTLDLKTGVLRPHDRADLITKLAPVAYDPTATCPRFERFLEEVQPDPERRAYLKRLAGYTATGVIREHVLPINYGAGRNGKGVFTNILLHVLGDYAITVPTELLMAKQHDDHPTGRADLHGCRLAVAAETEQNRALATSLVKQLTGGDAIAARRMHKDFFRFTPTHKLVLSTNHRPVVKETKDAIWDRVHLVPWEVRFAPEKQDLALGEKLQSEAPGILRWIVEGCLEWQRLGLAAPPAVVAATAQYRTDMDTLGDFVAESCVMESAGRVSRPTLRKAYETWADEIGLRYKLDPKAFADALRERGCVELSSMREAGRPKPVRGWQGIRLQTDQDVGTYTDAGSAAGERSDDVCPRADKGESPSTGSYVSTAVAGEDAPAPSSCSSQDTGAREEFDL